MFAVLLPVIDRDTHWGLLGDLDEIVGGIIRRDGAEFYPGHRRDTLHLAMETFTAKHVDGEDDRLVDTYLGKLGLFQTGDYPVLRRDQRGQMGSDIDVGAKTRRDLPQLTVGRGDDLHTLQVDLCQLEGGFGTSHIGFQRVATDDDRFTVLV